jgi:hypothetical protein
MNRPLRNASLLLFEATILHDELVTIQSLKGSFLQPRPQGLGFRLNCFDPVGIVRSHAMKALARLIQSALQMR